VCFVVKACLQKPVYVCGAENMRRCSSTSSTKAVCNRLLQLLQIFAISAVCKAVLNDYSEGRLITAAKAFFNPETSTFCPS